MQPDLNSLSREEKWRMIEDRYKSHEDLHGYMTKSL